MSADITVHIAGDERTVAAGTTAADLFADDRRIVVALASAKETMILPVAEADEE